MCLAAPRGTIGAQNKKLLQGKTLQPLYLLAELVWLEHTTSVCSGRKPPQNRT